MKYDIEIISNETFPQDNESDIKKTSLGFNKNKRYISESIDVNVLKLMIGKGVDMVIVHSAQISTSYEFEQLMSFLTYCKAKTKH